MKKKIMVVVLMCIFMVMVGCDYDYSIESASKNDVLNQSSVTANLLERQPTPTDIDYSLERYNLIKRAYWVNGQREKANQLICAIQKPLGYIVLFTENGSVVGRFTVDGKVTCLNSFLTPSNIEQCCANGDTINTELADVDGSYGENDSSGIFFFTIDGNYIEWTGDYIYSDMPFEISDPVLKIGE